MPLTDLRDYIVQAAGIWQDPILLASEQPFPFSLQQTKTASRLMLRWSGDVVVLSGPLRLRVTLQSENVTFGMGSFTPDAIHVITPGAIAPGVPAPTSPPSVSPLGVAGPAVALPLAAASVEPLPIPLGAMTLQASTVYSYVIEVPAGQTWPLIFRDAVATHIGTNLGHRVVIEPALVDLASQACPPPHDLPCDFGVANIPDTARFFPVACEPCDGAIATGLPPGGPTLAIPTADGGCVRPRYFNGMFITREDMEAEQRYFRIKGQLQNRAAGQGVVWGLNVGKQGGQVCVLPGYAVDCCGNDLTVTSVYKVDIATLLRDPAAAAALAGAGSQRQNGVRMHLLLEYVECPSDPRPVHGDPCGGTTPRCEMSRVRETVRLRLVPPCDLPLAGPLQAFLDEVRKLRIRYPLPPEPDLVPAAPHVVPFRVRLTGFGVAGNTPSSGSLTFRPGTTPTAPIALDVFPGSGTGNFEITRLEIEIEADPSVLFVDGELDVRADAQTVIVDHQQLTLGSLDFAPPKVVITTPRLGSPYTYVLGGWTTESLLAPEEGPRLAGTTQLAFTVGVQNVLVTITPTQVAASSPDLARGCSGEPCSPVDAPAVLPGLPWLHVDPIYATRAGDPKALALAALGGWLAQLLARTRAATPNEIWTSHRLVATALYKGAWLLFYGLDTSAGRADILESLRKLLRSLCEGFLYKGPECHCEPHGVVIGCTLVAGGSIGEIDPYGGRRWVMHAPLLTHWGKQLGLAPLDVIAGRFFSLLCCVAALPAFGDLPAMDAVALKLGNGYLTFGPPVAVAQRLLDPSIALQITATQTLSFGELLVKVIQVASESDDGPPPPSAAFDPRPATRYTLGAPFASRVLSVVTPVAPATNAGGPNDPRNPAGGRP